MLSPHHWDIFVAIFSASESPLMALRTWARALRPHFNLLCLIDVCSVFTLCLLSLQAVVYEEL